MPWFTDLMINTSANVYSLLAPIVLLMIVAEIIYCLVKKNGYYSFQDSLIGIGTMMIAQCVNLGVAVAILSTYGWLYSNASLTHLEPTLVNYILCFIGVDFLFYWFHRAGHRINFFWGAHVPHHSAEELNYAVALRTGFFQRACSFLFYFPLAIVGFSPEMILHAVALNLLYQFVPHTRVVGKLPGWISSWLNTPYHHQVHHAANPIYWDKNYAGTFIIWDRMFGTYQDQTDPVYYGVSVHPKSWDPIYLTFHWYIVLWKDMLEAKTWGDRLRVWYKPPGWRPSHLPPYAKPPHTSEKDQIKYRTNPIPGATPYLVAQLIFQMGLLLWTISDQNGVSPWVIVLFIGMTRWSVIHWAAILENRPWVRRTEFIRILAECACVIAFIPEPYKNFVAAASVGSAFFFSAVLMRGRGTSIVAAGE